MSQLCDREIAVSAAPISGPERESSYQAGEEGRQAGSVQPGDAVPLSKVRPIEEQYRAEHDLIGGLTLRDNAAPARAEER